MQATPLRQLCNFCIFRKPMDRNTRKNLLALLPSWLVHDVA